MTEVDFAAELRAFARRLRAIRFRGTEAYLQDLDELARALVRRAKEIGAAPLRARPASRRAPEHMRLTARRAATPVTI